MSTYLHLARYSTAGMKAAMAEGMSARRAMYEKTVAAAGGSLIGCYVIGDGERDLAVIDEFPEGFGHAAAARLSAALKAGGALEGVRTLRLASAADFDAASCESERAYGAPSALSQS
jgi:uncharacterized protein with GYD domain